MASVAQGQGRIKIIYLDVNTAYGSNNMSILVANVNAINNQLFNLFMTMVGSADYEPTLGANLANYLFDPNAQNTWTALQLVLYNAVNQWMSSRIQVNTNSFIVQPDTINRIVYMTVSYSYLLLGISITTTMAIPIGV
jgi:phage baseplate assembly protein W